ncbi:MAG TPA: hypothetical protein ENI29_17655 [bacterium]|nr:hypothetical protein [bacterium]
MSFKDAPKDWITTILHEFSHVINEISKWEILKLPQNWLAQYSHFCKRLIEESNANKFMVNKVKEWDGYEDINFSQIVDFLKKWRIPDASKASLEKYGELTNNLQILHKTILESGIKEWNTFEMDIGLHFFNFYTILFRIYGCSAQVPITEIEKYIPDKVFSNWKFVKELMELPSQQEKIKFFREEVRNQGIELIRNLSIRL